MSAPVHPAAIHPTAVIDPDARISDSAVVGPYSIIGPDVDIGEHVEIAGHVLIERMTSVGEGCRIHHGAVLGTDPQDLKYAGEPSRLEVGAGTVIREYATLNRGTGESGVTRVGSGCLLMAYAHVAHDCVVGSDVVLANNVNLGGHVEIGDHAILGGQVGVHQFVRIGEHVFLGGHSGVSQDVPPYLLVAGMPARAVGLNVIGLKRRGFSSETIRAIRRAYRLVIGGDVNRAAALEEIEGWPEAIPEVGHFVEFIRASERGIVS